MSLFHERFRQLKEESGKTQLQIATDLGLKQQAVSYYSNGREPDYDTLIMIAGYFGVSLDYLLGMSDCKKPENTDFCVKTGLSEKAVEILSGEIPNVYTIYGKTAAAVIDQIICSDQFISIVGSFHTLTNPRYLLELAKKISLFPDEGSVFLKSKYEFMIAAAEKQLSDYVAQVGAAIRVHEEKQEGISISGKS